MSQEQNLPGPTEAERILYTILYSYPTFVGVDELKKDLVPDEATVESLLQKGVVERGTYRDVLIEWLHDALMRKSNDYRDGRLYVIDGEDPQIMEAKDKGYGITQLREKLKAYTEWESAGRPEELAQEHFNETFYRVVRQPKKDAEANSAE